MHKRSFRVGELVVASEQTKLVGLYSAPTHGYLGDFEFGMFLGCEQADFFPANDAAMTMVFVLESRTLCFGWVLVDLIRKVEP